MIDPLNEELISPTEAARIFPKGAKGKPLHVTCIYRYMSHGCRGVVLESVNAPKKCTSRQAVARFIRDLTGEASCPGPVTRSCPEGRRSNRLVEEKLDRFGL
jgi:hypothetical protein